MIGIDVGGPSTDIQTSVRVSLSGVGGTLISMVTTSLTALIPPTMTRMAIGSTIGSKSMMTWWMAFVETVAHRFDTTTGQRHETTPGSGPLGAVTRGEEFDRLDRAS